MGSQGIGRLRDYRAQSQGHEVFTGMRAGGEVVRGNRSWELHGSNVWSMGPMCGGLRRSRD